MIYAPFDINLVIYSWELSLVSHQELHNIMESYNSELEVTLEVIESTPFILQMRKQRPRKISFIFAIFSDDLFGRFSLFYLFGFFYCASEHGEKTMWWWWWWPWLLHMEVFDISFCLTKFDKIFKNFGTIGVDWYFPTCILWHTSAYTILVLKKESGIKVEDQGKKMGKYSSSKENV